jgi:geranylgeranyl diphosphate synthase, type II
VTLIRLTLLLPALAGGASEAELVLLERLAEAWGHAYQVADDFKDLLLDGAEAGKSVRRDGQLGRPNLPAAIGRGPALRRLERWLLEGRRTVSLLGGRPELLRLQEVLEREAGEVKRRLAREASR